MISFFKKNIKNLIFRSTQHITNKVDHNLKINNEILWSQIFNSSISDSVWLLKKSFNPGRWALGYPALYITYRILDNIKPKSILEFGLGESTKLTYQYTRFEKDTYLCVIEQDKNWLDFFSKTFSDIHKYVTLCPIIQEQINGELSNVYQNLIPSINTKKYDFILIDGPFGSKHFSRFQIIDIITNNLLAEDFVILLDDYDRVGEQETIASVKQLLVQKNISFIEGTYIGLKSTIIICSDTYKFLVSL